MLSREELINLAVDKYFIACNRHDHASVMKTFGEQCIMRFPAAQFRYAGLKNLSDHFEDFLGNFTVINFHDFINIVDAKSQSIVSYFKVDLTDRNGAETKMENCNIFHCNAEGLFKEIIIYNTAKLDKGFHAGHSEDCL